MCSFFKFRLLFLCFVLISILTQTKTEIIQCEKCEDKNWTLVGPQMTCFIESSKIVEFENNQLTANKSDKVTGLSLSWNANLVSLPENINEIFSNLETISADGCHIQKLRKKNFAGLKKLKNLQLNSNPIVEIPDDTFEDLTSLEYLHLSK